MGKREAAGREIFPGTRGPGQPVAAALRLARVRPCVSARRLHGRCYQASGVCSGGTFFFAAKFFGWVLRYRRSSVNGATAGSAVCGLRYYVVARFGKVAVAARAAAERAQRAGALTAGVAGGEPDGELAQGAASGGGGDAPDASVESDDDSVGADDVASDCGYDSPPGGSGGAAAPAVTPGRVKKRVQHYEVLTRYAIWRAL